MSDIKGELSFLKNGIEQIAIIVEDLDKAVETYTNLLGLGPWAIFNYGKPLVKEAFYRGQPADFAQRVAFTSVGSLRIELIQTLKEPTIYADHVREHGYGLHHIGVLVEDMEACLEVAAAAGLEVTQEGTGFGLDGDGHYAYLGTEKVLGIALELIKVPARRDPPLSIYPPPAE